MNLLDDAPGHRILAIRSDYVVVFNYNGHVVRRLTALRDPLFALVGPAKRIYVVRAELIDILDPGTLKVVSRIMPPNGRHLDGLAFADGRLWSYGITSNLTHSNLISTTIANPGRWTRAVSNVSPASIESAGLHSHYLHVNGGGAYRLSGTHATAIPAAPNPHYDGHDMIAEDEMDAEATNGAIARNVDIAVGRSYQSGVELEYVSQPGIARGYVLSPIGVNTLLLSPSGRWIVTTAGPDIAIQRWGDRSDVRTIEYDQGTQFDTSPIISPDGTTMFYVTTQPNRHSGFDLYFHRYPVDIGHW